jgi:PPOX class probable F420-dependent enzyme
MSVPTADQHAAHAARLDRFLSAEPVVWLSTVRPDGAPHIVPIWFTWDGASLLVFSKPGAQKVRNLRANPVAMLALGEPEDDFDVALAEATVRLLDEPAHELPAAHLAKYGERMAALGLTPDEFLATYSQVMVITPSRSLPWHGRTTPRSVLAVATIQEPVRARELHGEPIGPCPFAADESATPEPASGSWASLVRALTGVFRPATSPLSSSAS